MRNSIYKNTVIHYLKQHANCLKDNDFKGLYKDCHNFVWTGELTEALVNSGIHYSEILEKLVNIPNYFMASNNTVEIELPNHITRIGVAAFEKCNYLNRVVLNDGLNIIGAHAFWGCYMLTKIVIPDSVIHMQESTFNGCVFLKDVTLGKGLSNLSHYVFNGCSSLKNITLSENIFSISNGTFKDCKQLQSVQFNKHLETIDGSFIGCTALDNVELPSSVQMIDTNSFLGCTSLKNISYAGTIDDWYNKVVKAKSAFKNVPARVVHCIDGDAKLRVNI